MSATDLTQPAESDLPRRVISVDAMGGDRGPKSVVNGMAKSARKNPRLDFIVHGPEGKLTKLVAKKRALKSRVRIVDAPGVVAMTDKPAQVMRNGKGTSMWSALTSVREGDAEVCVSCGNTGALMALAMLRLRKMPGVDRPAIACLWPSRNAQGFNVMLDVGADIRADAQDLLTYARMGASYARNGLDVDTPRVGLLNVGTEDHKGGAELQKANELLTGAAPKEAFEYEGFVEGGDIPGDKVDVVVTDGYSGNIALKTGEGTAKLIRDLLKEAFSYSILSRFAAMLAIGPLKRLQKRIDPRRVNGGVFLGLNGTVVKSHGSADPTGVSAAIKLAFRLADQGFTERLAARVASADPSGQSGATDLSSTPPKETE